MSNEEAIEIIKQDIPCEHDADLIEAFDIAIKAIEQTTWIPVSERLPEEGQEILFSTKTGRVHSGKYHDDDSANQWYSYRDKCRAWNNVVSAWMPLPKPYKSEGSETKQDLAYADQETMMPAT